MTEYLILALAVPCLFAVAALLVEGWYWRWEPQR
jgi:hypothetical protein